MKKFFALLLATLLFGTIIFCLSSCAGSYDISYDELYVYENGGDKRTLVFDKDGTGVYTVKTTYYKLEATVDFMWTVSEDGSLYMFDEKVTFKEGSSTYNYDNFCALTDFPCSFSSDVIGFLTGSSVLRFIRQGSELDGLGSANQRN